MLSVCYCIAQFLEIFLGIGVIQKLYPEKREHSIWFQIILMIACVVWGMLATWNAWLFFVSNTFVIVNSLFFSALIFAYYSIPFFRIFSWELFYNTTLALAKMLLLILEGVLEQKTLHEVNLGARSIKETAWCFIMYLAIFIIIFTNKNMQQILRIMLLEHKKILCVVYCVEWGMLTYSMYLGKKGFSTTGFTLHFSFVLCAVLVMLYMIWYILYQQVNMERNRLDTFQNMLEKQNQALQMIYNQNSQKMHDVKHVMLYLKNCLDQGKTEEAKKQIFQYANELKGMERKVWTGFSFLDFILNYKKAEMDEKGISFKLEVELYNIPLKEAELGIVLGNLLDNAIEAASQCELQKRNIYLKIGNMNQMFLLCIKNSSTKIPCLKKGHFVTTKEDSYAHGLGVKSVKRIVEDKNGSTCFQYDKEHFEVTILI